ncbi:LysM peptidoglycan-binding domain-containing protein [Ereboglobus luteus]|uniref:LysM domain-containing protein n=1 Tax=Ereboglobus luteus TaxID=1796921 RepID=A0A2U8DZD9_9BACT|nr:LysM peptidoglycan-binding domain-containing protein [Ereboglobus luteus]AWI07979.1 hypothetical protein CKA38_00730 [Ereboglobus luteus]
MKILKMIGLVVAVHAVVLTFGFILPGCQSTARTSHSTSEKTTASDLSRIDAARAATTVGGQPDSGVSAPDSGHTGQAPLSTAPDSGSAFTGGPVTNFSVPASSAVTPTRPQAGAETPAIEPEPPPMLTYTVVSGDSAWKIAKKFKISTNELLAANELPRNPTLQVGQKLRIPARTVGQTTTRATTQATQAGTNIYKVQAGDSLAVIARRYNTTVAQIQSLNKLTGTSIRIGQELVVPSIADAPATTAPAPAATTDASGARFTITHIVKPGESLDVIARHYGTSRNEIATTNHITDPRKLQAGQKLTITSARKNLPADAPASAATTPAAQQPAAQTPPPATPPPPVETAPVSPISPVSESPISPAPADAPPVVTPQDPVR